MAGLFYKLLYSGLLACAGIISLIIATIVWRKMWLAGKSFAELGKDGNAIIFMSVLVVLCGFIAWWIKMARDQLDE